MTINDICKFFHCGNQLLICVSGMEVYLFIFSCVIVPFHLTNVEMPDDITIIKSFKRIEKVHHRENRNQLYFGRGRSVLSRRLASGGNTL